MANSPAPSIENRGHLVVPGAPADPGTLGGGKMDAAKVDAVFGFPDYRNPKPEAAPAKPKRGRKGKTGNDCGAAVDYHSFLARRRQSGDAQGFEPIWLPDCLFPFQRSLTEWAIRRGRAALLEACGLGKTVQQLTFAENVVRKTNRPVLLLTPLAVGAQTVRESAKFGMEAVQCRDGNPGPGARIVVTNYERLHHFSPDDFSGVVCDESSILKNFDGKTRAAVTEFMRTVPYRLLCTATPAPNDYDELGTSSEALGDLGYADMLTMFFRQQTKKEFLGWGRTKYRLKGHAETGFWRWVCSWARAVRKPSDIGFDDGPFLLPPLSIEQHVVKPQEKRADMLFDVPAVTLQEQREESRRTLTDRCEKAAELASHAEPVIAWCHLNPEGDLLEKLISGAVQVCGSQKDEEKEELLEAFVSGQARALVSKPEIAGFGLNFQHCAHQTFFPSHSFEQWHQAIHRSLRFGQTRPVRCDVVTTPGEVRVMANLERKRVAAEGMFSRLVELMNDQLRVNRNTEFTKKAEVPSWLTKSA